MREHYIDFKRIKEEMPKITNRIMVYVDRGDGLEKLVFKNGNEYLEASRNYLKITGCKTMIKKVYDLGDEEIPSVQTKLSIQDEKQSKEIIKPYKGMYISNKGKAFKLIEDGSLEELSYVMNGKHKKPTGTKENLATLVYRAFKDNMERKRLRFTYLDGNELNDSLDNLKPICENEVNKSVEELKSEIKRLQKLVMIAEENGDVENE